MLEIIKPRERKERTEYMHDFEWDGCHGCGYSFPCDEQGNINFEVMHKVAREYYADCMSGTMVDVDGHKIIDLGIKKHVSYWTEPAIARCTCGHKITLASFTNTCSKCGQDFNMSGQALAPRSQWGEETGETAADILSIGHTVS